MGDAREETNTVVPVARILNLLATASRLPENRDRKLHAAILEVLDEVGADALIFRIGRCCQALGTFHPKIVSWDRDRKVRWDRPRKDRYIEIVAELARMQRRKGCISEPFRDESEEYLFIFPNYSPPDNSEVKHDDFSFFCFVSGLVKRKDKTTNHARRWRKNVTWPQPDVVGDIPRGTINGQYLEVVKAYCSAIEMAMVRRAEADSVIPSKISREFWNAQDNLPPQSHCVRPWEHVAGKPSCPVATASLSFDLRSSTFVMEHSIDKGEHAKWLEKLTIVMRALIHQRNGVFDKFTGDGVLAHFPIYSFEKNDDETRCQAVCNCVSCAWDMVLATKCCAEYMQSNLTLTTERFGAAVGVAFDMATWSHDESGNPIVVGGGVVHACRLSSDRDENGVVLVTNAAFTRLESKWGHQPNTDTALLVTKEVSAEHKVTKFRMTESPEKGNVNPGAIREIVRKIFEAK